MTVPVALEEIIDGLDTETNEEDDNLELAKEGGVHEEINYPKWNKFVFFLILQHLKTGHEKS